MIPYPEKPALLVDDEPMLLESLEYSLLSGGITNVVKIDDSRKVMPFLAEQDVSIILLDLNMPYLTGTDLLLKIKEERPEIPVTILTGIMDINIAVRCMKNGAYDYMLKPVEESRLITCVRNALEMREIQEEYNKLKSRLLSGGLDHPEIFEEIITVSHSMRAVFQYVESTAVSNRPILIAGETGTGKELIARAIHRLSERKGEFVPVNVAGLDDTLFSDALFGHVRGAFTGAEKERQGFIEKAAGGTLFLDEIGDLSMLSQVKLLRLLQEGEYYPLGSDMPKMSAARIVVATHKNIRTLQEEGTFRKDLYYRLRAHQVSLPPLRKRKEDIPHLVSHFLEEAAAALGKSKPTAPQELFTLLSTYHFPGNIRELQSMIFDAVSRHHSGVLSMESFREAMSLDQPAVINIPAGDNFSDINTNEIAIRIVDDKKFPTLKDSENFLISEALRIAKGNQTIAAQLLGISRQALNKRLSRGK